MVTERRPRKSAPETSPPKVAEAERRRRYELAIRSVVKEDGGVLEALAAFDREH